MTPETRKWIEDVRERAAKLHQRCGNPWNDLEDALLIVEGQEAEIERLQEIIDWPNVEGIKCHPMKTR